jgi:hypothetical protein
MGLGVLPFTVQLPAGYSLPAGGSGAPGAVTPSSGAAAASATGTAGSQPTDVVTISSTWDGGAFTAVAGDVYRLGALFKGGAPAGQSVAGYRVAMSSGSGELLLNNAAVAGRTTFTPDEFAHLTYTAGIDGSQQSLVVVAQTGKRLPNGTLSQVADSLAVQITADVTGTRSISALNALASIPSDADAGVAAVVKEASVFTGFGSGRPTLSSAGNFTAAAGDVFRLGALYKGSAPTGQSIAGYRIALGSGGGRLLLNNADVSDRTGFTADEFAHLTYTAGADGAQQTLVVVAQTGTRLADGALTRVADSQAVQITAEVSGARSINAMNALVTTPIGADAAAVAVVKEASVLTGFGSGRPTLSTDGNFAAVAGDIYRLGSLFKGSAPAGQSIAGYRIALGSGGGTLLLNAVDVSGRTSFTADEFAHLTYTAGADGSQQSLVVVAQTGKRLADGTLTRIADSQAMQITADVTGTRSINAMNALATIPTGADGAVAAVVKEAGVLTGFGSGRPTLSTDGNFTAVAGDIYRLGSLFKGNAPAGQSIAGYRIALGSGDGQLLLNAVDVSNRTSFTTDEFAHLTYAAGAAGSQQSLVVVAQTGKRLADGTLTKIADSQAVQISAAVTGTRSINAMNALATTPSDADADVAAVVKEAGVLTGFGSGRPALSTDGNFTAVAGDTFRLGSLFKATAPAGQSIAGYRIALGGGSGQLLLDAVDVSDRTSFTADEFAHLTYMAGVDGSQQNLLVVAQTGKRPAGGVLTHIVDSQAVQITANVTGTRSINAMNALTAIPIGADEAVAAVVKEAGILVGLGSGRPILQTQVAPPTPPLTLSALAAVEGAYATAGLISGGSDVDLSSFYPSAIGSSISTGSFSSPGSSLLTGLLLLGGSATGAFRTAGSIGGSSAAIEAYTLLQGLNRT